MLRDQTYFRQDLTLIPQTCLADLSSKCFFKGTIVVHNRYSLFGESVVQKQGHPQKDLSEPVSWFKFARCYQTIAG